MSKRKLDPNEATRDTPVTLQDQFKQMNQLMFGVVIVLFITLAATFGTIATLVISHFDDSQSTYQDLRDQVKEQNEKDDELTQELKDLSRALSSQQKQQ